MKKVCAYALVVVLMSLLAAGNPAIAQDKYVIGVSMSDFTQFLKNVSDAIERKAETMDNVEVVVFNAQNDIARQLNDVDSLITQQVDAIILNPLDREGLGGSVDLIKEAGIPLVEVNTYTENDAYDVYVGSQEEDAGRIQADFIVRTLGEEGKIVVLHGVMGHSGQIGRFQGLKEGLLDKYPGWELIAEQTGNWKRDEGLRITEDWLQRFPDIDVIASQNDEMAMGALQAVEAEGKLDDILVLGVDATPDAIAAVKEGKLAVTVFQDSQGQGEGALEVAVGLLEGKTYDKQFIIPYVEVNPENADEFAKKLEAWE